jgi:hypothetical protein
MMSVPAGFCGKGLVSPTVGVGKYNYYLASIELFVDAYLCGNAREVMENERPTPLSSSA